MLTFILSLAKAYRGWRGCHAFAFDTTMKDNDDADDHNSKRLLASFVFGFRENLEFEHGDRYGCSLPLTSMVTASRFALSTER